MRATLEFLLYDWLRVESLTQRHRFAEHSRETFDAVLETSERIAREKFAPVNRVVDVQEPRLESEKVILPSAAHEAISAYMESGLLSAGHDHEHGGMQLPYTIDMAANAFFSMGSIGLSAYAMLAYANCNLVMAHGTPAQLKAFARPIQAGRALGTMCLSEPQAGSSLADIATRAVPDGEGFASDVLGPRYRIRGSKMWISGGEHDLSENIIHLVLAKIPSDDGKVAAGVGGLSLFIVPRHLVATDGRRTDERNDVSLAGLNHKLGYRATVNTLLNFGEGRHPVRGNKNEDSRSGAIGYLVGEPGHGLSYMFHMMNEARINVGMGATMIGYAGYLSSLEYAKTRTQGRLPATAGKNPQAPPVRIVEHADVKRMLVAQKSYVEGGLALGLFCALLVDERNTGDEDSRHQAEALLGLLTPIAKSWPSEWCLEANNLAIQVHGGYGYTRDFPVEQFWRDNRLNMIHEGTHGIQAIDLLGRKVGQANGSSFAVLYERIRAAAVAAKQLAELEEIADSLLDALEGLVAATKSATSQGIPERLANATPYMQAFGHVVIAWMWVEISTVAVHLLPSADSNTREMYLGKVQTARFFARSELPKCKAWLRPVAAADTTALDMQEAWF